MASGRPAAVPSTMTMMMMVAVVVVVMVVVEVVVAVMTKNDDDDCDASPAILGSELYYGNLSYIYASAIV